MSNQAFDDNTETKRIRDDNDVGRYVNKSDTVLFL